MLRFFIAGIIQGSKPDGIHGQDYRDRLKEIFTAAFPDDEVFCPFENHPESLDYDDGTAGRVFFALMQCAPDADVCADIDEFEAFVASGGLARLIQERRDSA